MRFSEQTIFDGIVEREFTLGEATGVLWTPATATRSLVLVGHGGGQHKKAPGVLGRAHRYVTECGFAVAALDAPGHGGRPKSPADEEFTATLRAKMAAGEPVGELVGTHNGGLADRAVPEWRALLDALPEYERIGYAGVSLGTQIGLRLVAAEPRINAAVLGLAGGQGLLEVAARVTVPVEFLLQWDDELVPREGALAVFDAFPSAEKTLHANPGGHGAVPRFEVDSSVAFFTRHLAGSPAAG